MTVGDEYRRLVTDFLLDLVLEGSLTPGQARVLNPAMNRPGSSAGAARDLARFDRQVLRIKPVRRKRRWVLTARNRGAESLSPDTSSALRELSSDGADEEACNCYSSWYCMVHNPGWLP